MADRHVGNDHRADFSESANIQNGDDLSDSLRGMDYFRSLSEFDDRNPELDIGIEEMIFEWNNKQRLCRKVVQIRDFVKEANLNWHSSGGTTDRDYAEMYGLFLFAFR